MLRDIAAKPQMRGREVLGRFLFSIPPDLVGNRKITPDVIPDDVIHSYNETLKSLIIDLSEWTDHAIIPLSPAALKVLTEWRAEIEPRLKLGSGDLEPLRDWASKLPGATARLAGLLHLAENPKNGVRMSIHEVTMRRAVDLARYFAEHTMVAFGVMRAHPALDDARSVLEWIGERTGFKQREVQRALHRRFETVDGVAKALALLEDHGYIVTNGGGRVAGPARRRARWAAGADETVGECMSWVPSVAARLLTAVVLLSSVTGCEDGAERGASSCSPPMLTLKIGSSTRQLGSCAGQYQDLGSTTLKPGGTITADIPRSRRLGALALPQSSAPAVVAIVSRTPDGRHERFRAMAPGAAVLLVRTPFCSPPNWAGTPSPPGDSEVPWGLCRVLHVDVTGG
ncbi:hypothetical protein GCM10029978_042470 [Actinoallomurus acanthiterrae]